VRIAGVRRAAVLAGGMVIGVFGLAGAAFAHVTVSPSSAPQGSLSVVTFRVPTESDTASTTKVDLNFDVAHPIAVVNVQQVPGWTVTVKQQKLTTPIKDDDGNEVTSAVSEIVWTATTSASAIAPGQFQQFPIELGPLPATSSLAFKVLQTYSDGKIVRWIQTPVEGQPEPDNPTPILTITPASGAATSSNPTSGRGDSVAGAAAPAAAASSPKSNNTWGIVGSLLGLIGAVLGGAAYARTRSNQPQHDDSGTPTPSA
jgi:periplasmic copper chaperone A